MFCCLALAVAVATVAMAPAAGEVYTSLSDMERLAATESRLIGVLDSVIQSQTEKLEQMRRIRHQYVTWNSDMTSDMESYVHNPINAYLLVKRLSLDWQRVANIISDNSVKTLFDSLAEQRDVRLPGDEDLVGAVTALVRLQETYNLNTSDMARGVLNGAQLSRPLSASDCFELGRQLYIKSDFKNTAQWMWQAWSLLNEQQQQQQQQQVTAVAAGDSDEGGVLPADVLEYLAFSVYKTGDVRQALHLTNRLLQLQPDHPRAVGNKAVYETELSSDTLSPVNLRGDTGDETVLSADNSSQQQQPQQQQQQQSTNTSSDGHSWSQSGEYQKYMALCRGDIAVPASVTKLLRCFYTHNNSPYLLLQPVKTEQLYHQPALVMFHDVISETEMNTVKQLALPRMARATVQNSKTGALETASYRVSKTAWLKWHDHQVVAQVNGRVAAITGLNVETAEELQVSNYGIGGHYEPHYDFARRDEVNAFKSLGTGNRIATFIFYMSDVRLGGATVFTELGVTVWPRRGSAVFWYNLRRSGDGDLRTRHAACPVLVGNKWVANKWMHEQGQEFIRPCATDSTL